MFDKVRIETLLNRVENAILLIQSKAGQLETPNDFLLDKEGTFLLSGICMQLIFIGESIKTIDNKTSHAYLTNYPISVGLKLWDCVILSFMNIIE